ncbi:anti-sigma factor family protein [Streptomyces sp. NPDC087844]|uniref:anti-sigma factor family protein n=1 Tax=Streptomyces sp. NPDC087844 TaxID=3365805 RepID=UPI00381E99D8
MTSTTDTAGHPDVTEISDLTEGLLPPSRSTDVRRHLDDCTLCADVYDSLEEIRGMLGTLPGPLRMPDDVVGRIDAALAAESLLNATAPGVSRAGALPSGSESHPSPDDEREGVSNGSGSGSGHVSRETSTGPNRPAGHPRAATGPGRTNRPRRGRRSTVVLGAMFTAAALGLGGLLIQAMGGDGTDHEPPSVLPQRSDSANTFAGEKLESQVTDLLAKAEEKKDGGPRSSRPRGTESTDGPKILNTPTDSVPSCVMQGIGRDATPIASREGSYEGTEAFLVVLPAATDVTQVTAYVVDSACVDKPSISTGKVLLERSYPRS